MKKSPGEGREVKSDSRFYSGVYSAVGEPWPDNGQCGREKLEHGNDRLCAVCCSGRNHFSFMVCSADGSCCIAICAAT